MAKARGIRVNMAKKTLTSTAQLLMPCVGKNENPAPPFIG
jgi:hypothetical protein